MIKKKMIKHFLNFTFVCFAFSVNVIKSSSIYEPGLFDIDTLVNVDSDNWENSALSEDIIDHAADRELVKNSVYLHYYTKDKGELIISSPKEKSSAMKDFVDTFNSTLETKIIIHGWFSGVIESPTRTLNEAYSRRGDYNLMALNWKKLAFLNYSKSVKLVHAIGAWLAEMIEFLVIDNYADLEKIHLIGHSLGAHIAGCAGTINGGQKVGRITGLDPAWPLVHHLGTTRRLDKSDARFVDVIHTAGGLIGYTDAVGHVDFYPNGGKPAQPGCFAFFTIFSYHCSHTRACDYFIESINNPLGFKSVQCDCWEDFKDGNTYENYAYMGEWVNHSARGKFYLKTKSKFPFSL